jgi:hypothetical protein
MRFTKIVLVCAAAACVIAATAQADTIAYDVNAYFEAGGGAPLLAQGEFLYDQATGTVTNVSLGPFGSVPSGDYLPILTYFNLTGLELRIPSGEGGCPFTCGSTTFLTFNEPLGTNSTIVIDGGSYAPDVGTGADYIYCGDKDYQCSGTITEVPEPPVRWLLLSGVVILGWAARRRHVLA